jgi:hypothetical protein
MSKYHGRLRRLITLLLVLWAGPASAQKVLYVITDNAGELVRSGAVLWFAPVSSGGGDAVGSAEGRAAYPHRIAGTFSCMGVRVVANTFTGANSATYEFRVNGVTTAMTVTIPAGGTGWYQDCDHPITIAAADVINTRLLSGTEGGKSMTLGPHWIAFDPPGTSSVSYHVGMFSNWNIPTGTRYAGFIGIGGNSTVEAAESIRLKTSGTITHMQVWNMNSRKDGDTFVTLRKNGADANKAITVPQRAAERGYVSTTGVDTFAPGDTFAAKHTTAGTGSASYSWHQIVLASSDNRFEMGAARQKSIAAGAPRQYVALSDLDNPTSTESSVQTQVPFAMRLTALRAYVRTNGLTTSSSTLAIRVNGADAATIAIAPGATGWIDPGGISVTVAAGDKVNFAFTPGATGTAIELSKIMMTAEDATPVGRGAGLPRGRQ